MRRMLIPIVCLVIGTGAYSAWSSSLDSFPKSTPEVPSTVTDSNERLRLILEQQKTPPARGSRTGPTSRIGQGGPATTPYQAGTLPGSLSSQQPGTKNPPQIVEPSPVAVSPSYILREGDVLEVRVFQEDDLTARVRLSRDGIVTLPLLGNIRLSGRTVDEARAEVQRLYAADYLVNPQVLLTVTEYAKRRFAVMGQVQQPGFYNIPENEKLNLLQAISMAGGFTRLANTSRIVIKRNHQGTETVLQVNAQEMGREKNARLLEIQAEDAIIVSQRIF